MRSRPTASEDIFRKRLVDANLDFKFQMILGFYILDFVIPEKLLCIEIDGSSHDDRKGYDAFRDGFIRECGFEVLRIQNEDVETYDLALIESLPSFHPYRFRSVLSRANSKKGAYMERKRHLWREE